MNIACFYLFTVTTNLSQHFINNLVKYSFVDRLFVDIEVFDILCIWWVVIPYHMNLLWAVAFLCRKERLY